MEQKTKQIEDILKEFNQDLNSSVEYSYHITEYLPPSIPKSDLNEHYKETNENDHEKLQELPLDGIESPTKPENILEKPAIIVTNPENTINFDQNRNRDISFNKPDIAFMKAPLKKEFLAERPRTYMDKEPHKAVFVAPKKITQVLSMTQACNQITLEEKNFRATRKITQKLDQMKKDVFVHRIKDHKSNKVIILQEEEVQNSEYNPYLIPYRLDLALIHQKAARFGLEEEGEENQKTEEKELVDCQGVVDKGSMLSHDKSSILSSHVGDPKECPCCFESIEKKNPGLCFKPEHVSFLGHAFPLYMTMVKALIWLIMIPFIFIVFIPHMYYLNQHCEEENGGQVKWFTYCQIEDESEMELISNFLKVVESRLIFDIIFVSYFVLAATGLRVYGLRYIRRHWRGTSIGQFTVLVKGVPIDAEEEEIKDFFVSQPLTYKRGWLNRKLGLEDNLMPDDTKIEISEINFVYNFNDLIQCNSKIMRLIKTRRKLLALYNNIERNDSKVQSFNSSLNSSFTGSDVNKNMSFLVPQLRDEIDTSKKSFIWEKIEAGKLYLQRHLRAIDHEIIEQHELQLSIIKGLKENTQKELGFRFCGQVFISFTNAAVSKKIVQIFRALYDPRKRKFRGEHRLIVEPAANPEEIIWENLGIYSHKKLYIRMVTVFLEIIMLALTTYIVFLIYNKADSEELFLECCIAVLVLTINKLLMIVVSKLVEHERHKTKATVETLIVMFTLPLTLVNIMVFELVDYGHMIVTRECLAEENNDLWEMEKIMHKLLFVNIFVSLGEPILAFIFDFTHWSRVYHRFRIKGTQGYKNYCQEEVNKIFEGGEIELFEFYSHTCISFVLGMFAAPFFPTSILITMVGFILNYWLLKYNMLYRCKVESHQCNRVIGYFLLLVNLAPVFYMISLFFMSYYARPCDGHEAAAAGLFEKYEIVCWVELGVLVVSVFKWFRPIVFWGMETINQKSLLDVKKERNRTYDHLKSLLKLK